MRTKSSSFGYLHGHGPCRVPSPEGAEKAQVVNHFLNCEDLSLDSRNPSRDRHTAHVCNPSAAVVTWAVETGEPWKIEDQLAWHGQQ